MSGRARVTTPTWSIKDVRARIERERFEDYGRALERERRELAGLYEDETTWLAETLNGSMRSRFTFRLVDGELTAKDGRQLRGIFENSKERAQTLAGRDSRMQGEVMRTDVEWEEFLIMDNMAHDRSTPNTVVVNSAILAGLEEDIHGYQASRGLGWSRIITRDDATGDITICSQSLDGDEREAYNAIYTYFGRPAPDVSTTNDEMLGERVAINLTAEEQAALPDIVMGIYDTAMDHIHGGAHRAGRHQAGGDTWQFTLNQADLIKDHLWRIAPYVLSQKRGSKDKGIALQAEAIRYGTAAALRRRYELGTEWTTKHADIASERGAAVGEATASGESFNGCGFNASATTAQGQFEALGYGVRQKVRGPCPFCDSIVDYDPCEPKCSECGPYGNDVKKYRQALGQRAIQARRNMVKRKIATTVQLRPGERIILPNGSEMIAKERLVVGGTKRYFVEKGTGREVEASAVANG